MFFLLLFSAFIVNVNAQIIEGVVLDSATKEPLSFATIYFEGTTIGTTTNANGKFLLTLKNRIFANLIVSSIGYESEIVEPPFDSIPRTIYLKEKAFSLGEVTVTGKQNFKDIAKNNKYSARRQKIYAFSKSRFFKLLYDRKMDYSDFYLIDYNKLLNDSVKFLNAEEVFFRNKTISDSSTVKIILNPELKNTSGESRICVANIKTLYGVIGATQKPVKAEQTYTGVNGPDFYSVTFSKMFFRTGTFNIDSYGNTDLNKNLFLNGTMGMQRLGDQLPLDYLPPS